MSQFPFLFFWSRIGVAFIGYLVPPPLPLVVLLFYFYFIHLYNPFLVVKPIPDLIQSERRIAKLMGLAFAFQLPCFLSDEDVPEINGIRQRRFIHYSIANITTVFIDPTRFLVYRIPSQTVSPSCKDLCYDTELMMCCGDESEPGWFLIRCHHTRVHLKVVCH